MSPLASLHTHWKRSWIDKKNDVKDFCRSMSPLKIMHFSICADDAALLAVWRTVSLNPSQCSCEQGQEIVHLMLSATSEPKRSPRGRGGLLKDCIICDCRRNASCTFQSSNNWNYTERDPTHTRGAVIGSPTSIIYDFTLFCVALCCVVCNFDHFG